MVKTRSLCHPGLVRHRVVTPQTDRQTDRIPIGLRASAVGLPAGTAVARKKSTATRQSLQLCCSCICCNGCCNGCGDSCTVLLVCMHAEFLRVVSSVKSCTDQLRSVYRTATVDDERVSCIVTQLPDAETDSCLDCINSIVVSAAVHSLSYLALTIR